MVRRIVINIGPKAFKEMSVYKYTDNIQYLRQFGFLTIFTKNATSKV
jgi:hypothetical protein